MPRRTGTDASVLSRQGRPHAGSGHTPLFNGRRTLLAMAVPAERVPPTQRSSAWMQSTQTKFRNISLAVLVSTSSTHLRRVKFDSFLSRARRQAGNASHFRHTRAYGVWSHEP